MTTATVVGNATRDPELRYGTTGTPVASLTVAVDHRRGDQDETSFFDVTAFGDLAENLAATVTKGCRVIVTGRLQQRSYETKNGEKRSTVEIVAVDAGPSLRWATATVARNARDGRPTPAARTSGRRPAGKPAPAGGEEPF